MFQSSSLKPLMMGTAFFLVHFYKQTSKKKTTTQLITFFQLEQTTRLQCPSRNLEVFFPSVPVHDAEEAVQERKDNQLPVEQLVDATLPSQQQVEEGPQSCISDPARVRHRHGSLVIRQQ